MLGAGFLLLLVAAAIECCQDHEVCLRHQTIDTRNAANLSDWTTRAPPLSRDQERCSHENLDRQVIVKLDSRDSNAEVREGLEKLGCAVVDYLPHSSWSVFLPANLELDRVREIRGVAWIGEYKPSYKVAPEWDQHFLAKNRGALESAFVFDSLGRVVASVLTVARGVLSSLRLPCAGEAEILQLLIRRWNSSLNRDEEDRSGVIALSLLGTETVEAAIPLSRVKEAVEFLSKQDWVTWIAPAVKGLLGNMLSSAVQQSGSSVPLERGAPFFPSRPLWGMGIMGDGQVIAVGDSGVDMLSCYFRDDQVPLPGPTHRKVLSYRAMWGGDLMDSYGHGSHVCGSILGQCDQTLADYSAESSKYNGMAPHAKLVFTDIGVGKNTYVTPPVDLSDYY